MKAEHKKKLENVKNKQTDNKAKIGWEIEVPGVSDLASNQSKIQDQIESNFDNVINSLDEIKAKDIDLTPLTKKMDELVEVVSENKAIVNVMSEYTNAVKEIKPVIKVNVPEPKQVAKERTIDDYKPVDTDTKTTQQYFGYVDKEGAWYIMRLYNGKESQNYRYAKGDKDYSNNWRKRKSQAYVKFDEVGL